MGAQDEGEHEPESIFILTRGHDINDERWPLRMRDDYIDVQKHRNAAVEVVTVETMPTTKSFNGLGG